MIPPCVELSAIRFLGYAASGHPQFRVGVSESGRAALRGFSMNRVGSWIHLDMDGARLTSAFIGPALDLQEFTVSVDRPELSAKLHAIAQGLVTLPWLILGG